MSLFYRSQMVKLGEKSIWLYEVRVNCFIYLLLNIDAF